MRIEAKRQLIAAKALGGSEVDHTSQSEVGVPHLRDLLAISVITLIFLRVEGGCGRGRGEWESCLKR
jgi:hypothetical protein